MLVERALAILFENRRLIKFFSQNGAKELVAFGVATAICVFWHFDA